MEGTEKKETFSICFEKKNQNLLSSVLYGGVITICYNFQGVTIVKFSIVFAYFNHRNKWKVFQETILREVWNKDTCPMTQFFIEMDKVINGLDFYVKPIDFDFDKFVPRNRLFIFRIKLSIWHNQLVTR